MNEDIALVRIIGIGSPFGDDQLGWQAIRTLEAESLNPTISLARCESPSTLLQLMQGAQNVYLIDAVQTGADVGTIQRWQGEEVATVQSNLSSHGIDIASVLALGQALGNLPPHIILYGIEIGSKNLKYSIEGKMSAAVENAMPVLLSRLKKEVESV
jgi:hydrogenase maturation protease